MSAGVVRGFSVFFFLALLTALFASFFVVKNKESVTAGRDFQALVTGSEGFSKTFGTADIGMRQRLSRLIFLQLESSRAVTAVIKNARGDTVLQWTKSGSFVSTNGDSFSTLQLTSSLAGLGTLAVVYNLVSDDTIRLLLIIALIALSAYALILVFVAAFSAPTRLIDNTAQKPITGQKQENPSVLEPEKTDAAKFFEKHDQKAPAPQQPQELRTEQREAGSQESRSEQNTDDVEERNEDDKAEKNPRKERDSKFLLLDRASGVSQEQFLSFRLDKELQRSAENTVDLSFAIVRFPGIGPTHYSDAASLLLDEFSHEDLIFEYAQDAFCVILTEHDLDQAIARMELFIRKADQRFTSMPLNADSADPEKRRILRAMAGLTSRNGRIIDAKRFLKEAGVALKKASVEEGRIVGFRPDPLRFRHYLRHQRV